MKIVEYTSERSNDIASLFTQAVHEIDDAIYDKAQKNVWAPKPIDYKKWEDRLARIKPFIMLINNQEQVLLNLKLMAILTALMSHLSSKGVVLLPYYFNIFC